MSGSIHISSGSENDLQSAVANVGPVSVAVDASNNAFRVSMGGLPIMEVIHLQRELATIPSQISS